MTFLSYGLAPAPRAFDHLVTVPWSLDTFGDNEELLSGYVKTL